MTDLDYSIYYARFHPDSTAHVDQMVSNTVKELGPLLPANRQGHVIDVGCGYGFALLALKKLGFANIEGLEASSQQAARARQAGLKVEVTENTPEWLGAKANYFSVVLLYDVLEHVPVAEQIPLLRAIYKALSPGGRLIIQVPNANAILATRWRYNDFTHHSSFTEHSLHFALKNAGFGDIEFSSEKGLIRPSLRLWRKDVRVSFKTLLCRRVVRWCWLQVFKAELPLERIEDISFELNLRALAFRRE